MEHTFLAKCCLFPILAKAPEPSPIAIALAALSAFSPPRELWRYYVNSIVPQLAIPDIDPAGVMLGYGLPMLATFLIVYWVSGFIYLALELKWCPETIEWYRIQKVKTGSRPEFTILIKNLLVKSFVVLPMIVVFLGFAVRMEPELPGPWEMFTHIVIAV